MHPTSNINTGAEALRLAKMEDPTHAPGVAGWQFPHRTSPSTSANLAQDGAIPAKGIILLVTIMTNLRCAATSLFGGFC